MPEGKIKFDLFKRKKNIVLPFAGIFQSRFDKIRGKHTEL